MATIKERLWEVARDLGEENPKNTYFERLLGVSSGRVSQLFDPHGLTKLGAGPLARLEAKGFSPTWVQTGAGEKRLQTAHVVYGTSESALERLRMLAPRRAAQLERMITESLEAAELLADDIQRDDLSTGTDGEQRPFNQAA